VNQETPPFQVPHFEEPGRSHPVTPGENLSQETYARALDHLVITCVDIALVFDSQVFLAKRRQYPRKSWWLIGGRMRAGESPLETAQRKLAQEAGLTVTGDRLHYVGVYSTCFAIRAQPPQHHGSHSVNLTYQLQLTAPEKTQISLDPQEYEPDWGWFDFLQLQHQFDCQNPLDQALLKILGDLQPADACSPAEKTALL